MRRLRSRLFWWHKRAAMRFRMWSYRRNLYGRLGWVGVYVKAWAAWILGRGRFPGGWWI